MKTAAMRSWNKETSSRKEKIEYGDSSQEDMGGVWRQHLGGHWLSLEIGSRRVRVEYGDSSKEEVKYGDRIQEGEGGVRRKQPEGSGWGMETHRQHPGGHWWSLEQENVG